MRKFGSAARISVLIVSILFAVGGCKGSTGVSAAGSTSVQPYLETLVEKFEKKTSIRVNVQGGGSSVGVQSVNNGSANIGLVSRELKPEEKGLKEFIIAKDGIAVIVHPSNPVSDLTKEQLKDVFSGKIKNWKDAGGNNKPITVVVREEGSGTRDAFLELVMDEASFEPKAIVQGSTGAVRQTVSTSPDAIGFMSMAQLDKSIKPLKIDGHEPSEEAIYAGDYPIVRPFILVTKGAPSGDSKQFIDYILSAEGQDILKESGVLPVNPKGK